MYEGVDANANAASYQDPSSMVTPHTVMVLFFLFLS